MNEADQIAGEAFAEQFRGEFRREDHHATRALGGGPSRFRLQTDLDVLAVELDGFATDGKRHFARLGQLPQEAAAVGLAERRLSRRQQFSDAGAKPFEVRLNQIGDVLVGFAGIGHAFDVEFFSEEFVVLFQPCLV